MKKLVIILFMVLALAGCTAKSENSTNKRIQQTMTGFNWCVFTDSDTGVQYICVSHAGVCPLFNADGTLYVVEVSDGGTD